MNNAQRERLANRLEGGKRLELRPEVRVLARWLGKAALLLLALWAAPMLAIVTLMFWQLASMITGKGKS